MTQLSIQQTYAPHNRCFGCGPANEQGLQLRSFVQGDELHATWTPQKHHEAFEGMLNGGIIGTLLDCHCNWTATWHLMHSLEMDHPPCSVTAEYTIKMEKPTPSEVDVELFGEIVEVKRRVATVAGRLSSDGTVTATCMGTFVAVREGHPAYHRW